MPVTISQQDYWDLMYQTRCQQNSNHNDKFDVTWQYPEQLGTGIYRRIELRQGVRLAIYRCQVHEDLIVQLPERSHPLEYSFRIAEKPSSTAIAQKYCLRGGGMAPVEKGGQLAAETNLMVNVHIEPEVFQTFMGDCDLAYMGLEHLMRPGDRYYYQCRGTATVAMQTVLHQILHCPFESITKKIYLESKVWELMALLLEAERERHQNKGSAIAWKPEDLDRIHRVKEILLQNYLNPPSTTELAQLVGLSRVKLQQGFRQVFNTTPLCYLQNYRLDLARILLQDEKLTVTTVAHRIGYANASYFSRAFKHRFGVTPGKCRLGKTI